MLFVSARYKFPVIANQRARWCGNPPVERNQVTITTENRNVSPFCRAIVDTFPSNWEIATPVCALARNDSEYLTNNNFPGCRGSLIVIPLDDNYHTGIRKEGVHMKNETGKRKLLRCLPPC